MASIFSHNKMMRPGRSSFRLPHDKKLSCNFGELVPIFAQDCLPGDTWRNVTSAVFRFAPMVAPVMHRYKARFYSFFVPYRLIWNDAEEFFGSTVDGMDVPILPYFEVGPNSSSALLELIGNGSLSDYLGVAPPATLRDGDFPNTYRVNSLFHRAYQFVYNEYFIDQNLDTPASYNTTSGQENVGTTSLLRLQRIRWRKDYFTSALPFAQRGPTVTLPIQGDGTVYYDYSSLVRGGVFIPVGSGGAVGNASYIGSGTTVTVGGNSAVRLNQDIPAGATGTNVAYDPRGSLKVDLSSATATTWNDIRSAARLQTWFENSARGGSRYVEQIKAHFGVHTGDARLDRPEYIGGGTQDIVISEVLQTSETDGSPQGNMAGHGVSGGMPNSFFYRVKEHGCIITVMAVMPDPEYMDVTDRFFLKQDRFDFAYPEFAHLGEQPVWNGELGFWDRDNKGVFGYQSRYAEYKFAHSHVSGDFRGNLAFWNHARQFTAPPNLNSVFVTGNPDYRIFAVTTPSVHHIYAWIHNDATAKRPLPKFGTPKPI